MLARSRAQRLTAPDLVAAADEPHRQRLRRIEREPVVDADPCVPLNACPSRPIKNTSADGSRASSIRTWRASSITASAPRTNASRQTARTEGRLRLDAEHPSHDTEVVARPDPSNGSRQPTVQIRRSPPRQEVRAAHLLSLTKPRRIRGRRSLESARHDRSCALGSRCRPSCQKTTRPSASARISRSKNSLEQARASGRPARSNASSSSSSASGRRRRGRRRDRSRARWRTRWSVRSKPRHRSFAA